MSLDAGSGRRCWLCTRKICGDDWCCPSAAGRWPCAADHDIESGVSRSLAAGQYL